MCLKVVVKSQLAMLGNAIKIQLNEGYIFVSRYDEWIGPVPYISQQFVIA